MSARRVLVALALLAFAACRPAPRVAAAPPQDGVGYPRCVAVDDRGNAVACNAPKRTYDGDSCVCADGYGHAYYGRVRERPR